jgi:glycosyltransferase involved in cell wall biosynthesis
VVAPLRLARGIQNKVLEAMAMGRPVVAAKACVEALLASPGADLIAADAAPDYVEAVENLLSDPARAEQVGRAGRQCVLARYDWAAHMAALDPYIQGQPQRLPAAGSSNRREARLNP